MDQRAGRILAKSKPLDHAHAPTEETSIRVQIQDTTVMAVYEVLGNTLILASADFSDAQAPLEGAQPSEVASRLLHALAEAAMTQGGDPFMRDDGSPQQSEKGEKL